MHFRFWEYKTQNHIEAERIKVHHLLHDIFALAHEIVVLFRILRTDRVKPV